MGDVIQTYDRHHQSGKLKKISETDWPEDRPKADYPDANMERLFVNDANGIVLRKYQQGRELKQLVVNGQVITGLAPQKRSS